jgi:hypothetical protein
MESWRFGRASFIAVNTKAFSYSYGATLDAEDPTKCNISNTVAQNARKASLENNKEVT